MPQLIRNRTNSFQLSFLNFVGTTAGLYFSPAAFATVGAAAEFAIGWQLAARKTLLGAQFQLRASKITVPH
jgi:hypothetical protein